MVHCHRNARLTPRGRADVFLAVEAGMTVVAVCLACNVSRRCYYRWLPRWQRARPGGDPDLGHRCRGPPTYGLTDNERTVTSDRVAGIPVRHPELVASAATTASRSSPAGRP